MNSSRRKFAAILEALGVPPSARRQAATPAAPACESLEGRQLLTGGMGAASLGGLELTGLGLGVADVSGMGSGPVAWGGGSGGRAAMPGLGSMGVGLGQGSGMTSASVAIPGSGASSTHLQADLAKLRTDTQAIQDQSLVTPAMDSAVNTALNAVKAAETTTANPAYVALSRTVDKMVESSPGGPTLGQAFGSEIYQNLVYLSEGVPTTLINQLNAAQQGVMTATGITAVQESALAADHAAIAADEAAMKPVAGSTTTATPISTLTATMPTAIGSTTPTPMAAAPVANMGGAGELESAGAGILLPSGAGGPSMDDTGPLGLGLKAPVPSSTPAAQVTLMNDQATLKADTQTLASAVKKVDATSNVTPVMEAAARADLGAVKGAASASPGATAVATLQADTTTALTSSGGPTANQVAQIQADEAAVYASEGVNTALVGKLQAAQQAIISASGITGAEEGAIYADEQAVQADHTKVEADLQAITPTTTTTTTTGNGATTTSAAIPAGFGMRPGLGFRGMGGAGFLP